MCILVDCMISYVFSLVEAVDLVHASTHDDCTCMKREKMVSLRNGWNSTCVECIRYDFKVHDAASGLNFVKHMLWHSWKCHLLKVTDC